MQYDADIFCNPAFKAPMSASKHLKLWYTRKEFRQATVPAIKGKH